jgi:RNA polymerase sigma factor (sigma-70 family)
MDDHALIAPPPRRRFARRRPDPQHLVAETVAQHADSLLRVARRYTHCQADAEDAYQRALEIFVRSAHRLDPATVHRWLHTVVKHEAFAVREQRSKYVGVEEESALDALDDGRHVASVEERSERFEELTRAAEALKRLKPQEVTALVLKAQGLSYSEIAERQGWTYTKVNRCITEGRRSFLERYEGIRSGAECERWAGVLSAMADGEASAQQLADVRPHLRNCTACRSMLAGMQRSGAPVAALLPPAALGGPGGLLDRLAELLLGAQERVVAPVVKAQGAFEAASASKVAAVAASAAAIAGGGVAVERSAAGGEDARAAQRPAAVQREALPAAPPPPVSLSLPAPDPSGAAVPQPADPARATEQRDAGAPSRVDPPPAPAPRGAEFAAEAPAPVAGSEPSVEAGPPASVDAPAAAPAGEEFGFGG